MAINFSSLSILLTPTFLTISCAFDDQGEIVPALGPIKRSKSWPLSVASNID